MRITFLLGTAYSLYGSIQATLTTASALAARGHAVEIISVHRTRTGPSHRFDPRVPVVSLLDMRSSAHRRAAALTAQEQELSKTPSAIVPNDELSNGAYNRLTDKVMEQFLASSCAEIVISAWPALHYYLAKLAPPSLVTVAHDHLLYDYYPPAAGGALRRAYTKLDCIVAVAAAAASTYRKHFPELEHKIHHIPNAINGLGIPESTGEARLVVAAGRLIKNKRFDLLIKAFARVAREHPDWRLRIYGNGPERERLQALVQKLRLHDHVFLMGLASPMESEWVKGSIGALTSEAESFGIVILEAMQAGLPMISTDCPVGPGELIEHGVDGLLVPPGDVSEIAAAIVRLIEFPEQRQKMAGNAVKKASRFSADHIASMHEALYSSILDGKIRSRRGRLATRARAGGRSPSPSRPHPPYAHSQTSDGLAVTCTSKSATELELVLEGTTAVDNVMLTHVRSGETLRVGRSSVEGDATRFRIALGKLPHIVTGTWSLSVANKVPRLKFIDDRRLVGEYDAGSGEAGALLPVEHRGALKVQVIATPIRAQLTAVSWYGGVLSLAGVLIGDDWVDMQVQIVAARGSKPVIVPCATHHEKFSCGVEVASLHASMNGGSGIWRFWLADGGNPARRVRIGRIVSDMRDPASTVLLPSMRLTGSAGDIVRFHPRYSRTGLLTMEVGPEGNRAATDSVPESAARTRRGLDGDTEALP